MTISDLLKDILDTSRERLKTPISGAYIFAFLLWNWRPISLLVFEDTSITQKIIIINAEYSKISAMVGPFLLGLFFTIGIPYIMSFIDFLVKPAAEWRLQNQYNVKKAELENQILLVDQELELQDKKSRNKEKEDYENQIKQLKQQIEATNESNSVLINNYQKQIKQLTESINKTSIETKPLEPINFDIHFVNLLINSQLTHSDLKKIRSLPDNKEIALDFVKVGLKIMTFLKENSLVEEGLDGHVYFSDLGFKFTEWLHINDIKSINEIR